MNGFLQIEDTGINAYKDSHNTSSQILNPAILSIERCINKSYEEFIRESKEPLTLISGLSGCALFYTYSFKKFKDHRFLIKACELVDICIDRIGEIEQPSLYQGFTGIAWLIRHLVNQNIYDKSSLKVLEDIDEHIEKTIDLYTSHKYYSLMYGLIGHGVYFTEALLNKQNGIHQKNILKKIVHALSKFSIKSTKGITWVDYTSLDYHKQIKEVYNLGIPHGITGIVSFLSMMIDLDVEVETSKELLRGSLKWLLERKENYSNISYYPSLLADNEQTKMTRLGWAYGDLCSALAFLKGYKHLKETEFLDEAFETVMLTTKRNVSNSLVHTNAIENIINPGICMGTCGIILLYKVLNNYFQNNTIDERINYWMDKMLSTQYGNAEVGDYKTFTLMDKKEIRWRTDTGFLEGLSGIGLTLIYMSDNKLDDWKRVLLL